MKLDLFDIITYFIIYSFLGWIMESIVRSVSEKKLINTGFLYGPFCPIYGFGAVIMFSFLDNFANNIILLFIISLVILTAWEYIVGVLLEKIFKTKYWDYSDQKFNFQGRICLINSLCWGVLGVLFVKYIHPFIVSIISKIDPQWIKYSISILLIAFIIDVIISVVNVKNIKSTLEKVEKLNKEIKEKLKELKEAKSLKEIEKEAEKMKNAENIQLLIEKLKKKRNRTILHLYKNVYRLKKAFPAINTKEITEILNKKIEIRKNKKKS